MTHIPHHIDHTQNVDRLEVTMTGQSASDLVDLLESCDLFLRTASATVWAELRIFLGQDSTRPDACWLIDMLGFNAVDLRRQLSLLQATDPSVSQQPEETMETKEAGR